MPQKTFSKLVSKQPYGLILGIVFGFGIESILEAVSSGSLSFSWLSGAILTIVTYGAFALILFGFFYRKDGHKTLSADFLLGIGIGIILVWFIGASGT